MPALPTLQPRETVGEAAACAIATALAYDSRSRERGRGQCEAGPPQRSGKWLLSADAFERRPLPIPIVRNFIAVSRIVALRIVGRSKAETDLSGKLYEGFDAAAFHVRETRRQSTIITRRDANQGPEILTYGGSLGFRPKR